jgi:hypothetical protein
MHDSQKVIISILSDPGIRKGSNFDIHRVGAGIPRKKGRSMWLKRNAHKDAGFKEILMVLLQTWQQLSHLSDRPQLSWLRLEVVFPPGFWWFTRGRAAYWISRTAI